VLTWLLGTKSVLLSVLYLALTTVQELGVYRSSLPIKFKIVNATIEQLLDSSPPINLEPKFFLQSTLQLEPKHIRRLSVKVYIADVERN
jgi:hypothetical protein